MKIGNLFFGNSRGNYPVPRDKWQELFTDFLAYNGFDMYGYKEGAKEAFFENDVFSIRPYYCGDDDEIAELPNFVYKPTGYELSWYKYPLRDAYASKELSEDEFGEMLEKCEESLKEVRK